MKKLCIIAIAILAVGFLLYWYVPWSLINGMGNPTRIDTGFAAKAHIKNHFLKKHVDVVVTDKADVEELKNILAGYATEDGTACMFDCDVSVTLSNGRKSITFCPDFLDGEAVVCIWGTDNYRHLSLMQNKRLYRILNKYGMDIPFTR